MSFDEMVYEGLSTVFRVIQDIITGYFRGLIEFAANLNIDYPWKGILGVVIFLLGIILPTVAIYYGCIGLSRLTKVGTYTVLGILLLVIGILDIKALIAILYTFATTFIAILAIWTAINCFNL